MSGRVRWQEGPAIAHTEPRRPVRMSLFRRADTRAPRTVLYCIGAFAVALICVYSVSVHVSSWTVGAVAFQGALARNACLFCFVVLAAVCPQNHHLREASVHRCLSCFGVVIMAALWQVAVMCPMCAKSRAAGESPEVERVMRIHHQGILAVQSLCSLLFATGRAPWALLRLMLVANGVLRLAVLVALSHAVASTEAADLHALYPPGLDLSSALLYGMCMCMYGSALTPAARAWLHRLMLASWAAHRTAERPQATDELHRLVETREPPCT